MNGWMRMVFINYGVYIGFRFYLDDEEAGNWEYAGRLQMGGTHARCMISEILGRMIYFVFLWQGMI